jgi:tetratricopeptide (TPR) repeat protein
MILLTLILSLTGCADHVQTFEKYVREGNYSEAIHLYQDKLMDDVENYAVCQEQVQAYLDESLAAYAAGELPRGQMENVMTTMEMLEDYLYLVDGLEDGHTLFSRLKNSKDTFHEAEQYRQNGQYELAMETYSDVLPEDTEYYSAARENMEEMIRQIVEEERNAVIQAYESGDYPGVFQAYHAVENSRYGTVTEDLTEIREAAAMEYLQDNKVIGIFPEGTRSHDGNLLEFKEGAFVMAKKAGAPITVLVMQGSESAISGLPLHRPNIRITVVGVIPKEEVATLTNAEIAERVRAMMESALPQKEATSQTN